MSDLKPDIEGPDLPEVGPGYRWNLRPEDNYFLKGWDRLILEKEVPRRIFKNKTKWILVREYTTAYYLVNGDKYDSYQHYVEHLAESILKEIDEDMVTRIEKDVTRKYFNAVQ